MLSTSVISTFACRQGRGRARMAASIYWQQPGDGAFEAAPTTRAPASPGNAQGLGCARNLVLRHTLAIVRAWLGRPSAIALALRARSITPTL